MEKKINIAKLLKDCPKGMELNCVMFDNVSFIGLQNSTFQIIIHTPDGHKYLNAFGCYHDSRHAKCIIFPKGKTTWEGFKPPCNFKDGDIVATEDGSWIGITTGGKNDCFIPTYCVLKHKREFEAYFDYKEKWMFNRLATEEEKQKLFQAIDENGYKWNEKTKTLEKLVEQKFHKGDWVTDGVSKCQIHFIDDTQYWYSENCILGSIESVDKRYHLWTIQDAKDGDVLAVNWYEGYDSWEKIIIFKKYHNEGVKGFINSPCVEGYGNAFKNRKLVFHDEVPYFSKTWTANLHPATKEQRDFLFQKIKEAGYKWNEKTKTLEEKLAFKDGDILYVNTDNKKDNNRYKYIFIFKEMIKRNKEEMVGNKIISHCYFSDDYLALHETYLFDDIYPIRYATEEEKQRLLQAIESNGYKWNEKTKALEKLIEPIFKAGDKIKHKEKTCIFDVVLVSLEYYIVRGLGRVYEIPIKEQDNFNLVPTKFDINTLKPFESKVLVRDYDDQHWTGSFYSNYDAKDGYPFHCILFGRFKQCIPYEGNEHLLDKNDNCDDYYKNW